MAFVCIWCWGYCLIAFLGVVLVLLFVVVSVYGCGLGWGVLFVVLVAILISCVCLFADYDGLGFVQ